MLRTLLQHGLEFVEVRGVSVIVGTGHSIDQEGLLRSGLFLQQMLGTPGH